ncbi:hypothetical protein A2799_01795 [Candidatus Roizmanbacteria bacterium RIFCSPHIGHO2_01_FULL_39_24]|uniref:Uncharacterized protein n=1 Tax=Candidatus Roizmanbacteria bacterium RIFCSPHIGHO2_01_FULL_39_24 TaxID=1802032 RepID=A0A1F7GFL2_9BACT|nr:MAG: hypothetical protein A2799_01795 [Candidatus Roizmanbacteria bacterium RIFCSPHIGHO2_01_FULL_39_24]
MIVDRDPLEISDEELATLQSADIEDALTLLAPDVDEQEYLADIEAVREQLLGSGLALLERHGVETVGVPKSMSFGYRELVESEIHPKREALDTIVDRPFRSTPEVTVADAVCWLEANQSLDPNLVMLTLKVDADPVDGWLTYSHPDPRILEGLTLCIKRSGQDKPSFFHVDKHSSYNSLVEEARLAELQRAVFLLGQIERALAGEDLSREVQLPLDQA